MTWSLVLAWVSALVLGVGPALADYPERPIHLIIPFPPGGTVDAVARVIAPKLSEKLGQQVVVDNRGGASGVIASEITAKAPADGYTLLLTAVNHSATPALIKDLPYDSIKDFTMVSLLADQPSMLVAHPSVKFNTFPEFIAYARNNADLNYASAGAGTFPHLAMAMLISRAGLKMTHVPYKGAGPAYMDLLAGTVQMKVEAYITASGAVKAGKLKLLAVTSTTRMQLLPDVPTIAEMGFPGYEATFWMGVVGPKQLPEAIRAKLEKAFSETVKSEDIAKRLIGDGLRPLGGSGAELDALIKRELVQWQKVVKEANITLN